MDDKYGLVNISGNAVRVFAAIPDELASMRLAGDDAPQVIKQWLGLFSYRFLNFSGGGGDTDWRVEGEHDDFVSVSVPYKGRTHDALIVTGFGRDRTEYECKTVGEAARILSEVLGIENG